MPRVNPAELRAWISVVIAFTGDASRTHRNTAVAVAPVTAYHRPMRVSLAVPAIALVLSACGPEKGDDTGASSGADATANTATDALTGGTGETGGTGTGDTSVTPTTAGPDCSQYANDELGPTVEITIRHTGSEPVWLPAGDCSGAPELRVFDAMNIDRFDTGGSCGSRQCAAIMTLESCELACDPCAPPSLVRVDPGATIVVIWAAVLAEELEMTAECAPGIDCAGPCQRLVRAPEGVYTVELPAFLGCTGECVCDPPDPNNFCSLYGVAEGGEPTTFTVMIDYSAETAVEIVIP
jgi:hypothetical protein